MPELPEVETVRRQLHDRLAGQTIAVVVLLSTGREYPAGDAFTKSVQGKTVERIDRRAKLLIWRFTDGTAMVGHLKMTGKFIFVEENYVHTKHDRAHFSFAHGEHVVWSDVRQFGYVKLVDAHALREIDEAIGPEPLDTPVAALAERVMRPVTRKVKVALLDQATIAGVGNIYADEACHRAGIRPTRRLGTLSRTDRMRLVQEVRQVLQESIAQKGTSANDYVDTLGEQGGFLELLRVYGRAGKPCRACATPIKKIVLSGRGTHYCPTCQK